MDIRLYKPVDGVKELSGNIAGYTKEELTILTADGRNVTVALKDAAKISLHIDF